MVLGIDSPSQDSRSLECSVPGLSIAKWSPERQLGQNLSSFPKARGRGVGWKIDKIAGSWLTEKLARRSVRVREKWASWGRQSEHSRGDNDTVAVQTSGPLHSEEN